MNDEGTEMNMEGRDELVQAMASVTTIANIYLNLFVPATGLGKVHAFNPYVITPISHS